MSQQDDRERSRGIDPNDVGACMRKLNHAIGQLASRYGAPSVVAALVEVMGCAYCATDSVERGASLRALIERVKLSR